MSHEIKHIPDIDIAAFKRDGYVVAKSLVDESLCIEMRRIAADHLAQNLAPIEYEVDVQYPGSPLNADAEGGQTPRRLLHAYARHSAFREWALSPAVKQRVAGYLANFSSASSSARETSIRLSQCHHNCVMTKHPGYSSATRWHQDNRYWSFDEENLVSVWLALGDETKENGCLRVIPGSHKVEIEAGRFDAKLFLRTDIEENKALLSTATPVPLSAGDVLFFHSKLFHAAGRNRTDITKLSVVYTYHEASNHPIADTRSAKFPSIEL